MFDKTTVIQVLGGLMKKPEFLLDERYDNLSVDDFPERFHRMVFGAISNLIKSGVEKLSPIEVDGYLSSYTKSYTIFTENDGLEYLDTCLQLTKTENFDYNFKRLKKFSLLKQLKERGFDATLIYDDRLLDPVKQEEQQHVFDAMSINDILDIYDKNLLEMRIDYSGNVGQKGQQAGHGMMELKERLKKTPEMGAPMGSKILTTIARGARKKKLYMRSSGTGGGKTRLAAEDICTIAVRYWYDLELKEWIDRQYSEPCLFITTELEIDEIQTLFIAHVSGVNEDRILDGKYTKDEEERVDKAIEILNQSPIWIEHIPSFNMEDIERAIKKYKLNHKIGYVFFDYIFTSTKMLIEISTKTKGMKLREDNVLFIFVDRMKYLCNSLDIHFSTSSQLNGEYKHVKTADEAVLRGAKAMADKLDVGLIAMQVTEADLKSLESVLPKFSIRPNLVYHIYKVRRGKFVRVKLWCYVDLGICRTTDLFLTNNNYEIMPIDSTTVEQILEDNSLTQEEMEALERDVQEEDDDDDDEGVGRRW